MRTHDTGNGCTVGEHAEACTWLNHVVGHLTLVWETVDSSGNGGDGYHNRLPKAARAAIEHRSTVEAIGRLLPDGERTVWISHTRLGRPFVRMVPRDGAVQVSFSHEHRAHVCLASADRQIVRIGVDVVWLPRLRRRSAGYLHALAKRFMGDSELAAFEQETAGTDGDTLLIPLAARFSLMEATSKALGTGLRLGMGIGRPGALAPATIAVPRIDPVELRLADAGRARLRTIGGTHVEGHYGQDAEYLISVVLIRR